MANSKAVLGIVGAFTCASLVAYGAAAQNNEVYADQIGTSNDATITQDGDNNRAGSDDETRNTPVSGPKTPRHILTQDGADNELLLLQQGNNNQFASQTKTGFNSDADGFGIGFDQLGTGNFADVDQLSNDNQIARIQQIDGNTLTITQQGVLDNRDRISNVITTVYQENLGGSNEVRIFQERDSLSNSSGGVNRVGLNQTNATRVGGGVYQIGAGNLVDIVQDGLGGNRITEVAQTGDGNTADIEQFGQSNIIDTVTQDSTGATFGNSATVLLTGDDNGFGSFAGAAAGVGLVESTILQDGGDNSLAFDVDGDSNLFAFAQTGDGNDISGFVSGGSNEAAIAQNSDGNISAFNQIGDGNNLGITQD